MTYSPAAVGGQPGREAQRPLQQRAIPTAGITPQSFCTISAEPDDGGGLGRGGTARKCLLPTVKGPHQRSEDTPKLSCQKEEMSKHTARGGGGMGGHAMLTMRCSR